jgi:hypothetical protein
VVQATAGSPIGGSQHGKERRHNADPAPRLILIAMGWLNTFKYARCNPFSASASPVWRHDMAGFLALAAIVR